MTALTPALVGQLMGQVAPAEAAFRSRWRLSTLARVEPELYDRLVEQIGLYDTAMYAGTAEEAREQADAMVRGWRAACARLEDPLRADDAYLVGFDVVSGIVVVIAEQSGSAPRAQVRDGQKIITVTPDEVAKIVCGLNLIREAKSLFPDAEVVGFAGGEPNEGDEVLRHEALKAVKA